MLLEVVLFELHHEPQFPSVNVAIAVLTQDVVSAAAVLVLLENNKHTRDKNSKIKS